MPPPFSGGLRIFANRVLSKNATRGRERAPKREDRCCFGLVEGHGAEKPPLATAKNRLAADSTLRKIHDSKAEPKQELGRKAGPTCPPPMVGGSDRTNERLSETGSSRCQINLYVRGCEALVHNV
jgi:hypothetical protein